jgi:hypothetical protein
MKCQKIEKNYLRKSLIICTLYTTLLWWLIKMGERGDMRNTYKILARKPEMKIPLGRHR